MSRTTKIPIRLLGIAVLAICTGTLFGQSIPTNPEQPAPVVLDGRTVFYVRATVKSVTPEARAKGIAERIRKLAEDPYFRSESITVSDTDISTDISTGEVIITIIFDADAQAEGRSRQELGTERGQQIKTAIQQYRQDHSTRNIVKASALALFTTLVFLALLVLTQKLYRSSRARLLAWIDKDSGALLKKYEQLHSQQIKAAILSSLKLPRLIAVLLLIYFYVGVVFSFFPGTRDYAGQLLTYVIGPLNVIWQAVKHEIPKLFFILILVILVRYVVKLLRLLFRGVEAGTI
ncbi:MAG: hypothetical protein DMF69_25245, partial [Acidobacteria bacterium]